MNIKLRRIQAGLYETTDGKFCIENMYAPDSANKGFAGASPKWWKIQSIDNSKVFRVVLPNRTEKLWSWKRVASLQEAREVLNVLYTQQEEEPLTAAITLSKAQLTALNTVLYRQTSIPDEIAIELLELISTAQNELICRQNGWKFEPFNLDTEMSLMLTAEAYRCYRSGKITPQT